ncbi:DNA-damage-inducible protein J [Peptoniphilus asaccharolyticus DSM 20463]|uniref:DNA damage-inducible protein n=3 Tax=Peptoniphilus TaxID=162289 RepID=G4D5F0_9FIRM|nr:MULTISPECIES: type II toxin-antitoxin system RelB/DinJ family antitoxin [Peptoniphilus]EGY78996.1 DNA damage-inducible protein [Peptoniphilus indolicus ATCC 29427]MBL7575503.1 type II toxin-antitoxin system RelB/DinJ family antitoxin [Peptoniphilus asaccharolyticus]MDY2986306.1 type II toxin-antitoxin system RelB/DinJ family antitoxin [Peptoniphilus sp.]SMB87037.1 DNA-damage-inducible protein J [Peptoniphilus asaccharolyticus DSM 20463]SUB74366.1 addiction module antitoxin, RelB/DinJ family
MANVNLNIRLEENLKNEFSRVCDSMGMSMSTAFNVFAKAVVNDRKIPFEIKETNPIVAEFDNMDDFKNFVDSL